MISLDYQNLDSQDYQGLEKAIRQGASSSSKIVDTFEKVMSVYLGVHDSDRVIATNSGTSALHLALMDAGIKEGDKVALPVLTFVATANVIKYVGAEPIFYDVHPESWLIDYESRPEETNVDVIIPVDLYGNLVQITDCFKNAYQGQLIIDACESLGARFFDESIMDYVCYSFNGNKIITTGAGGLLVGAGILTKVLSVQAKLQNGSHFAVGYNYRMAGLNAALGLSQMRKLDYFLKKKRKFNRIYREQLSHILKFQEATPGTNPSWWMTAALWPEGIDIPDLQKRLKAKGIPTRRIFRPLNQSEPYQDGRSYPVAEMIYDRGLCLPSGTLMRGIDIYKICQIIKEEI